MEDEDEDHLLAGFPKKSSGWARSVGMPLRRPGGPPRRVHLKKVFVFVFVISLLLLGYSMYKASNGASQGYVRARLEPKISCSTFKNPLDIPTPSLHQSQKKTSGGFRTRSPARVLLVPKTSYSRAFKSVTEILSANRIGFKSTVAGKNLPDLIKLTKGTGKYGVVFFEDFNSYLNMDPWNRDILDKYCHSYNVGIVAFLPADNQPFVSHHLTDKKSKKTLDIFLNTHASGIQSLTVNGSSPLLRITRGGRTTHEPMTTSGGQWVTFRSSNPNYSAVSWAHFSGENRSEATVIQGQNDGISKVLFGSGINRHWLHKLLFLDTLSWLSNGSIQVDLIRYIQIDIDDIFVGKHRFLPSDVEALLRSQERLASLVPDGGFRYNLGFSGHSYRSSSVEQENLADQMLVANGDKFWWFPHMWQHLQPHRFDNVSDITSRMMLNREFARKYGIPVTKEGYAVAPHHSGVYPVHEQLYEAWTQVWNVKVTSTEEYPHLRPGHLRRGFVHRHIQVLPRQTCGLYTKNLLYSEYPGGPSVLEKSIRGGELFQTIVHNPVSIFMTHMPNYVMDRLAPYTFESVLQMIKCWTNLEIKSREPQELARIYFDRFADERAAIWGNPCDDRRHKEIWSASKSCDKLPDFLVIGPQKTGTTALYTFLQMHPAIQSNYPSPETFEELQFFSGKNYVLGIDWYMDQFPPRSNSLAFGHNKTYLFEKSATYFDRDLVPGRAHRLLKDAKLIAIITSPALRAYSWYQHVRAHNDPVALNYTFHQVITATNATKPLKALQSRCLEPGKYSSHLERWLMYYRSQQLFIVDGEELKYDPVSVMNRLQHFLNISPIFDYKGQLKFDRKKGFYCQVLDQNTSRTKCLGRGKGRVYPPMQPESQRFLQNHYRLYNENLLKLMKRLGYTIPEWLEDDLKDEDK